MPIYEYCCNVCNIQFELRQKFSDPPADRCPKCGGTVRKLVSAVSFSLKGAGWFGDGYGTKTESTNSEGDTSAGTGATTEAVSTDAAPAPAETHSKEHEIFTNKVVAFQKDFHNRKTSLSLEVLQFLMSWLTNHILETDGEYGRFAAGLSHETH